MQEVYKKIRKAQLEAINKLRADGITTHKRALTLGYVNGLSEALNIIDQCRKK